MSNPPALPSYVEVTNALKKTPAKFNAAQVHGLFCGLICGTSGKQNERWEKLLLEDIKEQNSREILQGLYETSYHLMSEFSFEFTLLLPADTKDINERTEALGLWCQGFLAGLKQTHIPIEHREPGEVTDAIDDIVEIAQVNFGEIPANDEEESAYFELVEYVRLAALMIFQDIKSDDTQKETDTNKFLH
jgi:yecA family protein